jgi:hypothetical protein
MQTELMMEGRFGSACAETIFAGSSYGAITYRTWQGDFESRQNRLADCYWFLKAGTVHRTN